ncbi:hypothetical protein GUJ93_ZPchr0014g46791 [Zizania palustris]|uniref:Uncharacterized protein n=1 Tax=Zizania palustris TaxID=103762 RepID=A0A8J5TAH1_ZIZPA|nr:hypothetical protein GUJ93_ZPchr0014g46791 [Zizania palustris]
MKPQPRKREESSLVSNVASSFAAGCSGLVAAAASHTFECLILPKVVPNALLCLRIVHVEDMMRPLFLRRYGEARCGNLSPSSRLGDNLGAYTTLYNTIAHNSYNTVLSSDQYNSESGGALEPQQMEWGSTGVGRGGALEQLERALGAADLEHCNPRL